MFSVAANGRIFASATLLPRLRAPKKTPRLEWDSEVEQRLGLSSKGGLFFFFFVEKSFQIHSLNHILRHTGFVFAFKFTAHFYQDNVIKPNF